MCCKNKKAWTLVEVLVTSIILAFVLTGASMFVIINDQLNKRGVLEAFLQSNLSIVTAQIGNDVRSGTQMSLTNANKLEIKNSSNSVITTWEYDSDNESLSRNGQIFKITGATGRINCQFTLQAQNILAVRLKLALNNGTQYQTSTGEDMLNFVYVCRNISSPSVAGTTTAVTAKDHL